MRKIPNMFKTHFFPAENINSLINSYIRGNWISYSLYDKFEISVNSLILRKLRALFSTVKLRTKFPNSSINSKSFVLVLCCTSKFSSINKEISGFLNVALAGPLEGTQFMIKLPIFKKKKCSYLNKKTLSV